MEILKIAIEWAKAEVFSTRFFIIFACLFLAASIGFWQLGKTTLARAYIVPTLVSGVLLLIIGLGLFFTNKSRISTFEDAFNKDSVAFVASEIDRAESTLKEYNTIVFKVIPILMIIASLLIIFMKSPIWRASSITALAMFIVILLIDGTAYGRMDAYHKQLKGIVTEKMSKE